MAKGLETYNVLVSLHQGVVSVSKLVQAFLCWDMADNMCEASVFLELRKLLLQPLELVSRVTPIIQEPPVQVIARLHVDPDDFALWVEFEWLRVISPLAKHFDLLLT